MNERARPAGAATPGEPVRPAGAATPGEPVRPAGAATPSGPVRPAGAATPSEPVRPAGAATPSEPVRPAVLIMARAPRRGEVRQALEPLIGLDGCMTLHTALLVEALRWARSLDPREIFIAHEPADAGRDLQRLANGTPVTLFPQNGEGIAGRVADGVVRVAAHASGPVYVLWPDLPCFTAAHASAVSADLAAGADLVLGPVFGGGYYLIALSRPLPRLFSLPEQIWRGPESFNHVVKAAVAEGLHVGVLRGERALHRPADARAALADPLLPDTIARILGRH